MTEAFISGMRSVAIPFKGQRDYVQGPDLVEASLKIFDKFRIDSAKFSSHDFIRNTNCLINIGTESSENTVPFKGQIVTDQGSFSVTIEASQTVNLEDERLPFDERKVTDSCKISDVKISRSGALPFTLTETIVSMKKALLEALYPDAEGKWIFTSVDYRTRPKAIGEVSVTIDHNFQNKLVKSSIMNDGKKIGFLYFSLVVS